MVGQLPGGLDSVVPAGVCGFGFSCVVLVYCAGCSAALASNQSREPRPLNTPMILFSLINMASMAERARYKG